MLTRADIEYSLIHRRGTILVYYGMDGSTHDGTNPDLNECIVSGIRMLGGTVQSVTNVTDSDVASVPSDLQGATVTACEYQLVKTLRSRSTDVDLITGPFAAKFSQLPDRLLADLKLLREDLEEFGVGVPDVDAGYITTDFIENDKHI